MPVSEVPSFVARTCDARRPPRLVLGNIGIALADGPPACRVLLEPAGRAGFRARAELVYDGEPIELAAPAVIVRARGKRIVRRRLDDEHAAALAVRALGGSLEHEWRSRRRSCASWSRRRRRAPSRCSTPAAGCGRAARSRRS